MDMRAAAPAEQATKPCIGPQRAPLPAHCLTPHTMQSWAAQHSPEHRVIPHNARAALKVLLPRVHNVFEACEGPGQMLMS